MWAIGIIAHELLFGKVPFEPIVIPQNAKAKEVKAQGDDLMKKMKVYADAYATREADTKLFPFDETAIKEPDQPKLALNFIQRLLAPEEDYRPSAARALGIKMYGSIDWKVRRSAGVIEVPDNLSRRFYIDVFYSFGCLL